MTLKNKVNKTEKTYRNKLRYRISYAIMRPFLRILHFIQFNYKALPFRGSRNKNYFILSNHTGSLDPFMLSLSFKRPIFFVASDHIMRWGLLSKIIDFIVAPIPIVKSKMDLTAIRRINRELQSGNTVCLFPSGSRSVSGPEEKISPAASKLIKILKKPVLLYRLQGGYLSSPRWARSHRRGKMTGQVVRELSVEEINNLSVEELDKILKKYLDANPYTGNVKNTIEYHGSNLAEYLERIIWHCPSCNKLNTIRSHGDIIYCDCGFSLRYDNTGYFVAVKDNAESKKWAKIFPNVDSLYQWQLRKLKEIIDKDYLANCDPRIPIFQDKDEKLILTAKADKNKEIFIGNLALYKNRLEYFKPNGKVYYSFPIKNIIDLSCIGPQRLQFSDQSQQAVFESINSKPRSAYKYIETIKQIKAVVGRTAL